MLLLCLMKVLALTHAHLHPGGLSPVSCERADSLVGTWAGALHWDIDVVYTTGTQWRGIWPDGKGLNVHVIHQAAPSSLMMDKPQLFSSEIKALLAKRQYAKIFDLGIARISKRARKAFSANGLAIPFELAKAKQWGQALAGNERIKNSKYDLIFVCAGYGDEYLLETGLLLSEQLNVPMIVDFRDLWSDHHNEGRFTEKQKKVIRKLETRLLQKTVIVSVPQKHMATLLKKWLKAPVYLLAHSAYTDSSWKDGSVTSSEFVMLYAGKLYSDGPGLGMLIGLIKKLAAAHLYKPFLCRFFVDDPDMLKRIAEENGVSQYMDINGWVMPGELWQNMRSAHLLLIPDSGVAENYPLLPTKTFQYAYTGRQILCLSAYKNDEMQEFLDAHHAGIVTTNVDDAATWVAQLSFAKEQYEQMPAMRNVPLRAQAAHDMGIEIEKIMAQK